MMLLSVLEIDHLGNEPSMGNFTAKAGWANDVGKEEISRKKGREVDSWEFDPVWVYMMGIDTRCAAIEDCMRLK